MPVSPHLPFELVGQIVDFATEEGYDLKQLFSYSRVSRQWYTVLHARIYSKWQYDGEHHSITSLWRFLRTLICSRPHADRLNILDIRNWTVHLIHGKKPLVFSDSDLDLLQGAIRTVGFQHLEMSFMEVFQRTDPKPLMALLLAYSRNLNVLYAELPPLTDIFFAEVLRKSNRNRQDRSQDEFLPLQHIREAYLTSARNYERRVTYADKYKLEPSHLFPISQLPKIEKLSVFDLDTRGAPICFGNSLGSSSIKEFTFVQSYLRPLSVPYAAALIALPKALTHLSVYLNDAPGMHRSQLSNVDLWILLQQYQLSIEYLDIYRDCVDTKGRRGRHRENNSHFGSMKGFKRLHSLCIQPEMLIGGCCGESFGPYRMADVLPPNLRSLTVYTVEGMITDMTPHSESQHLAMSTDYPHLTNFTLEWNMTGSVTRNKIISSVYEEVERTFERYGLELVKKYPSSLARGGRNSQHNLDYKRSHDRIDKLIRSGEIARRNKLSRYG